MSQDIGKKINELRKARKLTLKDVSAQTGLSIGFLSQFERGLSSIATDSLEKIADALDTEVATFFPATEARKTAVMRSYEKQVSQVVNSKFINYVLTSERFELYPGDAAHYNSTIDHNWANYTGKMVRILVTSC